MPEKFVVPQFIDNEDKILGPITVRQFLIMLSATLLLFIEFKLLKTLYFVMAATVTGTITGVFAFVKINGQPFHIYFINVMQTRSRPALRVWHKELTDGELKAYLKTTAPTNVLKYVSKKRPESTHLRDLALTVNTGGVYNADDDSTS